MRHFQGFSPQKVRELIDEFLGEELGRPSSVSVPYILEGASCPERVYTLYLPLGGTRADFHPVSSQLPASGWAWSLALRCHYCHFSKSQSPILVLSIIKDKGDILISLISICLTQSLWVRLTYISMCVTNLSRETKTFTYFLLKQGLFRDVQSKRRGLPHKIQSSEGLKGSLNLGFENHGAIPKKATEKTCSPQVSKWENRAKKKNFEVQYFKFHIHSGFKSVKGIP